MVLTLEVVSGTFAAVGVVLGVPVAARVLRHLGIVDRPNDRSSHSIPTARGAGLVTGFVLAVAVGLGRDQLTFSFAAVTVAGTLLGGFDDVRGLAAGVRLVIQTAIATVFVVATWTIGHQLPWPAAALTIVFIVGYTNAFNFMDGIDGISATSVAVAALAFILLAMRHGLTDLLLIGTVLLVVSVCFLPFNFPHARVFLGDSGSYSFGVVIACAAVTGWRAGLRAEAVVAPLSLYLGDTGTVLLSRVIRRERLFAAHSEHAYQRLVRLGASHMQATGVVAAFTVASACIGLLVAEAPTPARLALDGALIAVVVAYLAIPRFVEGRRRHILSRPA